MQNCGFHLILIWIEHVLCKFNIVLEFNICDMVENINNLCCNFMRNRIRLKILGPILVKRREYGHLIFSIVLSLLVSLISKCVSKRDVANSVEVWTSNILYVHLVISFRAVNHWHATFYSLILINMSSLWWKDNDIFTTSNSKIYLCEENNWEIQS